MWLVSNDAIPFAHCSLCMNVSVPLEEGEFDSNCFVYDCTSQEVLYFSFSSSTAMRNASDVAILDPVTANLKGLLRDTSACFIPVL